MRKALTAAVALLALAVFAAPASALKEPNPHKFVGTEGGEPRFSGEAEFELKPFFVECGKARGKSPGPVTFPSKTLTAVMKFGECEAEATVAKAEYEFEHVKVSPITFNYHANGFVEIGSGGTVKEGKLEGAGPIEITVKGPFKCTISIEPGTVPAGAIAKPEAEFEAVTFTNHEETVLKGKTSTLIKKLGINNALSRMHYELEGEFCEALPNTEFTNGKMEGLFEGEIKKGQLARE
jgi:hypothetical protein